MARRTPSASPGASDVARRGRRDLARRGSVRRHQREHGPVGREVLPRLGRHDGLRAGALLHEQQQHVRVALGLQHRVVRLRRLDLDDLGEAEPGQRGPLGVGKRADEPRPHAVELDRIEIVGEHAGRGDIEHGLVPRPRTDSPETSGGSLTAICRSSPAPVRSARCRHQPVVNQSSLSWLMSGSYENEPSSWKSIPPPGKRHELDLQRIAVRSRHRSRGRPAQRLRAPSPRWSCKPSATAIGGVVRPKGGDSKPHARETRPVRVRRRDPERVDVRVGQPGEDLGGRQRGSASAPATRRTA